MGESRIEKAYIPKKICRFMSGITDLIIAIILIITYESLYLYFEFNYKIGLFLFLFYYVGLPYITNGQTIGQYLFRIKTVSFLSTKLAFFQIFARQLISWFGINYIYELIRLSKITNNRNQLFHDRLLHTTVIKNSEYNNFNKHYKKEEVSRTYKITIFIILAFFTFLVFKAYLI